MKLEKYLLASLLLSALGSIFLIIYYVIFRPIPVSIFGLISGFIALNIFVIFIILLFLYLGENIRLKLLIKRFLQLIICEPKYKFIFLTFFSLCVATVSIKSSFYNQTGSDYKAYLMQWLRILEGGDPWDLNPLIPFNAYGPIYNLLAIFTAIHPLIPRLIFALTWVVVSSYLLKILYERYSEKPLIVFSGFLFLFANPFLWISIGMQAFFDILPATCSLIAIAFRMKNKFVLAGLFIAIGFLMKFYPIVLLPIIMIDNRRIRISPALSCIGFIILGFLISFLFWGKSTFNPLIFATERQSKLLSIYFFITSRFSPFRLFTDNPNLDKYSNYSLIISYSILLFYIFKRRIETSLAAIIGMMLVLVLYRTGYFQYYTLIFLIVPFWYATSNLPDSRKHKILVPIAIYLYWIIILHLAFYLFQGLGAWPRSLLAEIAGLPNFILSLWSIVTAISLGYHSPSHR